MSPRRRAFRRPLPAGWRPKFGERVYVRSLAGYLSRLVSFGTVVMTGDGTARVLLHYGRQTTRDLYQLDDLRPIDWPAAPPAALSGVECPECDALNAEGLNYCGPGGADLPPRAPDIPPAGARAAFAG